MSTPPALGPRDAAPLLALLLREQQDLGAAETFARAHERGDIEAAAARYRRLMPAAAPLPGQQYAFEVDLDRCTGCKACVTGCHNRNGLDAGETWRSVGVVLGGDDARPLLRNVTTACHHCVDPACLTGCPVLAYEKDSRTGIVRHLDDQCIGCQYCVMKCPYGVPQYSDRRGIVRKCDLCTDRLAHGEAPACVQSCPNDAIRITLADANLAADDCTRRFAAVPGSPDAAYTRPTTAYVSRVASTSATPEIAVEPAEAHPSLATMLALTQAAIGVFVWLSLLPAAGAVRDVAAALGLGAAVAGMVAALFHLGRPQWAFRAVLGLRTSWLSREIVALSLFVLAAAAVAVGPLLAVDTAQLTVIATVAGLAAAHCSAMVYRDTPRSHWARAATETRFLLGAAAGGGMLLLLAHFLAGSGPETAAAAVIAAALFAKLAFELRDRRRDAPEGSRRVLAGALQPLWRARIAAAAVTAVLLLVAASVAAAAVPLVALACAAWLGGETVDRHLFLRAAVAPRMP